MWSPKNPTAGAIINISSGGRPRRPLPCLPPLGQGRTRHLLQQADALGTAPNGFSGTAGLQELLDAHLDRNTEPSLAVRSVYGQYSPWLVYLDPTWAAASADRIVPMDVDSREYWQAAWDSYLRFAGSYDDVFDILHLRYELAVDLMAAAPDSSEADTELLGSHLMAFFARGKILKAADSLIDRFFRQAAPKARRKTLEFVGRLLMQWSGSLPSDVADRLMLLLDDRLGRAATFEPPERQELAAFGGWFISGRLDAAWSLRTLSAILDRKSVV